LIAAQTYSPFLTRELVPLDEKWWSEELFFRQSSISDNRVVACTLEEQERARINHPLV